MLNVLKTSTWRLAQDPAPMLIFPLKGGNDMVNSLCGNLDRGCRKRGEGVSKATVKN